jgi:predicted dehydrogenase
VSETRTHRFIHIGTGGWGREWCFEFLPRLVRAGRLEPAAAVDVSEDHLRNAVEGYGVSPKLCFTDVRKALDSVEADFMILVTPPDTREGYVELAVDRGLDILSEKPVADTMEACVRIYRKVMKAGRKMGVTMSHRFDQDEQSLQELVHSERLGELNSVVGRFTDSRGRSGGYGRKLNRFADVLLIHGSVHHLDILRAIARSNAKTVYARTWNPPGVPFSGHSSAFVVVEMENGVMCQYEGALANAATLNGWEHEYFRAECTEGTAILDNRLLKVLRGGHDGTWEVERVPLLQRPTWMNQWLTEQFLDWREGGPAMETSIEDNMQCNALLFAAVESVHTGAPVDVQGFLRKHLEAIPA